MAAVDAVERPDRDGTLAERPGLWRGCLLEVMREGRMLSS